jgi:heparan-alpha-glucosaminide N-acetyltransferase
VWLVSGDPDHTSIATVSVDSQLPGDLSVTTDSNEGSSSITIALAPLDPALGPRVASVDTLRGLTILLMIFVNDLGRAAPSWMHHIQPPNADGMTLADVVFPAFLFIVGVSIPLAFERRRDAEAGRWTLLRHILVRTLALLFMGLIQLNGERDRTLGGPVWEMLAFIGLIFAWSIVPREHGARRTLMIVVKILGIVGLIGLLAIFRGEPEPVDFPFRGHVEGWVWLRTEWWGILGLIGWAYLTTAILWLILGRRREWLMGALAMLMLTHLAMQRGGLLSRLDSKPWLGWTAPAFKMLASAIEHVDQYVSLGGATGSLAAISMAGCLLGSVLRRDSDVAAPRDRLRWGLGFAVGLLVAGVVADTFEGINKIGATPTWCLWSAALTCLAWTALYRVIDVGGFQGWTILFRPAGANPLLAYFLHPIIVELIIVSGLGSRFLSYQDASNPAIVVAGSLGMALFVCMITGLIARLGLRTRL